MRGDQGGKRGGSGPRQRSAAGRETWLLLGLGTWILSRLTIQGYGCSILNQVGRVQDFYWKNDPEG